MPRLSTEDAELSLQKIDLDTDVNINSLIDQVAVRCAVSLNCIRSLFILLSHVSCIQQEITATGAQPLSEVPSPVSSPKLGAQSSSADTAAAGVSSSTSADSIAISLVTIKIHLSSKYGSGHLTVALAVDRPLSAVKEKVIESLVKRGLMSGDDSKVGHDLYLKRTKDNTAFSRYADMYSDSDWCLGSHSRL